MSDAATPSAPQRYYMPPLWEKAPHKAPQVLMVKADDHDRIVAQLQKENEQLKAERPNLLRNVFEKDEANKQLRAELAQVKAGAEARPVCPHCHLPPVLPETCTPAIGAVLDREIVRDGHLYEAGYEAGKAGAYEQRTLRGGVLDRRRTLADGTSKSEGQDEVYRDGRINAGPLPQAQTVPPPPSWLCADCRLQWDAARNPEAAETAMTAKRERGLYEKFAVRRTDGTDAPGQKHDNCQYFVLDTTHDPHAAPALRAYANSCAAEYPALAHDLRKLAGEQADSHTTGKAGAEARVVAPPELTKDDLRAAANACGCQARIHDNEQQERTGVSSAHRAPSELQGAEWEALAQKIRRASERLAAGRPPQPIKESSE